VGKTDKNGKQNKNCKSKYNNLSKKFSEFYILHDWIIKKYVFRRVVIVQKHSNHSANLACSVNLNTNISTYTRDPIFLSGPTLTNLWVRDDF
jgi:hypothetical protein